MEKNNWEKEINTLLVLRKDNNGLVFPENYKEIVSFIKSQKELSHKEGYDKAHEELAPCLNAPPFVAEEIRKIAIKETLDKIKLEIDYSKTFKFKAGGLPEKYLELVEMIVRDAFVEGKEIILNDLNNLKKSIKL